MYDFDPLKFDDLDTDGVHYAATMTQAHAVMTNFTSSGEAAIMCAGLKALLRGRRTHPGRGFGFSLSSFP